jgi:ketosteroid isomerase-like protein
MRLICCLFTQILPLAMCLAISLRPNPGIGQEVEIRQKDREAIIDSVGTYVDAYNAQDVEALGNHWSESGEWIDGETGNRVTGREAIQQQFADSLKSEGRSRISVHVDSIRFVTRQVAVDGDADSAIETSCQWARNKSFLTRKFRVTSGDEVQMEGMQIIAWDPNAKTIRSWMFDSDGGLGEGIWKVQRGSWTVRFSQALPTGGTASSVNVYSNIQDDSFTFESIDRQVDGEAIGDVTKVRIVRKAPK